MASTCTSCGEDLGEGRAVCPACGTFNTAASQASAAATEAAASAATDTAPATPSAGGPLRSAGPPIASGMGAQGGWAAQPPPTEHKSNLVKLIAVVVAVVVVAGGIFVLTRDDGEDTTASSAPPGMVPGATSTSTTAVSLVGRIPVDFGDELVIAMASQPVVTDIEAASATGAPIAGKMWTADVPGSEEREFVIVFEVDADPLDEQVELEQAVRDNGASAMSDFVESTYNSLDGLMVTGTIYEAGVDGYVRAMALRVPNRLVIFGYVSDGSTLAPVEQGFQVLGRSITEGS